MGACAHPGARASRPHALPLPAAQFPCDGAAGHPGYHHPPIGSSPRLRGTGAHQHRRRHCRRFIPAPAGNR